MTEIYMELEHFPAAPQKKRARPEETKLRQSLLLTASAALQLLCVTLNPVKQHQHSCPLIYLFSQH